MHDTGKILLGLLVFLVLMASPFWYNTTIGSGVEVPDLADPKGEYCIKDTEWMRPNHMDLLDDWRDEVVREGDREKVEGLDGKMYEKSLTETCMDCHDDRAKFCDECHNYAAVDPFCWDCHVESWESE
ncbi:MAG: sulfate reduction electron transfer complex DsrMKJOP subunit DsrJ [bacterium]